jgi:hypothetical protein
MECPRASITSYVTVDRKVETDGVIDDGFGKSDEQSW